MIIIAALILALALIYNVKSKEKYHLRPRTSWAQVTVIGRTEDSETTQITTTLLADESTDEWNDKINWVYAEREKRLKYQNERIQADFAAAKAQAEEAEKALKEHGIQLPKLVKG